MIYDPIRWCVQCQKPKKREGFGRVRPDSTREACAECLEKIKEDGPVDRQQSV
jgi:hypothetical protein